MNTTLAKTLHLEMEHGYLDLNVEDLVKAASRAISPLGPINTFAARSPWAGMEDQSFEQVARKLKDTCDIDLLPNEKMFKNALNLGEIQKPLIEKELQKWLHIQQLDLPREAAEKFCRAALSLEIPSPIKLSAAELKTVVKKLSNSMPSLTEEKTMQTLSHFLEQESSETVAQELNRHIIKWCKLFLDESQAAWTMPYQEEGFYQSWRRLVEHDPALNRSIRRELNHLPEDAGQALKEALSGLEIPSSEAQGYLEAHLLSLPGWAGMFLWRSQQFSDESNLLTEYLAVRISLEYALIKPYLPLQQNKNKSQAKLEKLVVDWSYFGGMNIQEWLQLSQREQKARLIFAFRFDEILRRRLLLQAWENSYENHLKKVITFKQTTRSEQIKQVMVQLAFCIDVRSEPFRRKLEDSGPFETYGTAGFFGLPIETCPIGSGHSHPSLPVMFKPQHKILETASETELNQYQQRLGVASSLHHAFKNLKQNLLSSMLLPEISGPWLSLQTITRSFFPRSAGMAMQKLKEYWLKKPSTELSLHHERNTGSDRSVGFTKNEKVQYVRQALKMMSLTDHFAPLVVISGHGSQSTNNAYASALDCGACGGASSAFNARVLAEMCNLSEVREALATEGITIPDETIFVAAEHITSLDELRWMYVPKLSDAAQEAFNQINGALPKVCEEVSNERIQQLPVLVNKRKNSKAVIQRLAEDWSEVRPEWGLARNAAFVIGNRRLTEDCNLEGRVFLQNYNWRKDKNGALLSNIINGPATVAQWINLQYYASTVAPHYYGSGNKATQTVTAGLGVMQGNASDLLTGLPWQSVMKSDYEAYHAPLRLLVVIQAPKDYVKRLLEQAPVFQQKVNNGWVRLASIGPDGHWESW